MPTSDPPPIDLPLVATSYPRPVSPPSATDVLAAVEAADVRLDEIGRGWLLAVAAAVATPGEFVVAEPLGVGGHELALLDFDPDDAERLRRLGRLVGLPPAPGVATALAIAGSAAQGRVQPFPADIDFFERVHVSAPSLGAARDRLAALVRIDALRLQAVAGFSLDEVFFGALPAASGTGTIHPGGSVVWSVTEVLAGAAHLPVPPGSPPARITWREAAADPGFVKLDWFVTEETLGGPARVSKVIDATWDGPDGTTISLDGAVDADVQQVYLEPAAAMLAERLTRHLAAADRARYLAAMARDIARYARDDAPDFAKVTKRLYNYCRLDGRYAEALFVRQLLAESPARLHQARTALRLLAAGCDRDLARACADLVVLLDQIAVWLDDFPDCVGAASRCRSAAAAPTLETVHAAMVALDAALGGRVNDGFRQRLRSHPPTAALLAELLLGVVHG